MLLTIFTSVVDKESVSGYRFTRGYDNMVCPACPNSRQLVTEPLVGYISPRTHS